MNTKSLKLNVLVIISLLTVQSVLAQFGKSNKIKLPDTYEFDYIYKLKMTHKKEDIVLDYYLKEDAKYFGFNSEEMAKSNPDAKMFMVIDIDLEVTSMFMEVMGKKVVQKTKTKASDFSSDDDDFKDYEFKQIDSEIINGYQCDGYVSENAKQKITFYITDDVPVSFSQMFGSNVKNLPKGFNPALMDKYAENGLMMKMIFEDKKKPKNNMIMECTELEKTDFSIDTTEYGSMMGAFGGN